MDRGTLYEFELGGVRSSVLHSYTRSPSPPSRLPHPAALVDETLGYTKIHSTNTSTGSSQFCEALPDGDACYICRLRLERHHVDDADATFPWRVTTPDRHVDVELQCFDVCRRELSQWWELCGRETRSTNVGEKEKMRMGSTEGTHGSRGLVASDAPATRPHSGSTRGTGGRRGAAYCSCT